MHIHVPAGYTEGDVRLSVSLFTGVSSACALGRVQPSVTCLTNAARQEGGERPQEVSITPSPTALTPSISSIRGANEPRRGGALCAVCVCVCVSGFVYLGLGGGADGEREGARWRK